MQSFLLTPVPHLWAFPFQNNSLQTQEKERTDVQIYDPQAARNRGPPQAIHRRTFLANAAADAGQLVELTIEFPTQREVVMSGQKHRERDSPTSASALRDILLELFQTARLLPVPGADGLTLDDAIGCYAAGIAAGLLPNEQQLLQMHPQLSNEIKEFFASNSSVRGWHK